MAGKLFFAIAAVLASVTALAHVHTPSPGAGYPNSRSARAAEPLLFHVHGLAYSPDGKSLLVPAHTGLAAFRDDGWSEVNGPIHDFAGFSLAERAIYASGHPPPGSSLPNPLGLVKSTDLGKNWVSLALGGEADFHFIAAGYRSNAIYVRSTAANSAMPVPGLHLSIDDGKSWRRQTARGLEGEVFGIAAHPRADDAWLALARAYLLRGRGSWEATAGSNLSLLRYLQHVQVVAALSQTVARNPDSAAAHELLAGAFG